MLDLRYVVDHIDEVRAALSRRNPQTAASLDAITELAAQRRETISAVERKAAERNNANKEMSKLPKQSPEFIERREKLRIVSDEIKGLEKRKDEIESEISEILLGIPNLPDASTPTGSSEQDNPVIRTWGEKPLFDFEPKAHWDIGPALGIIDFERAAKLSGPRFAVMMGLGARLERALTTFMLDLAREHGYLEVLPPFLVKDTALRGTGQLPKFEQDLFKTRKSEVDESYDLFLIPTAEVPLTNLHANEILESSQLPLAYAAYTPCFRSEAGSYGKDVRGLIRQHQFDKVELVRFCTPEDSPSQHELLTSHAEQVLQRLGLHYRVITLCTGDLGFSANKTYDIEVWLPGLQAYREISSCSNFGDFQARRASIRYRDPQTKKPKLLHTLNGSGLAVGRTVVAVLEQFQCKDGSVRVPDALRPYLGVDRIASR
ncbi:MAG TPA: serine--tRNA ligase [Polyangiaceae bacterium]|jgi:seryl-tRNA synthetase|nr:MAG: Serine--tRNA ligase [Deltaproteobacteria bacterium ADurb.Bin207]HNS97823.1 serine--tRNA ligase [Polyangiaceae bacterium]HNZ20569.1 serine--tRNA ligase [Polyangiaceae bacterium]HOD20815.1 serine--tRNA ligase [Polyangiaceae bacterium]HOE47235.1 serine--tRNA ligase [Polyangiaceae bacterium]